MTPERLREILAKTPKPMFYAYDEDLCHEGDEIVPIRPEELYEGREVTIVNDSGDQGRREFSEMIADYFIDVMNEHWRDSGAIEDRADWIWTEGDGEFDTVRESIVEACVKSFGYARKIVAKTFILTPETLAVIRERMGVSQ